MASLWTQTADSEWEVKELAGDREVLTHPDGTINEVGVPSGLACPTQPQPIEPQIVHRNGDGSSRWVLLTPATAGVRVNGDPVPGVRLLSHQDEIQMPGTPSRFFSTEELARIEPFPGPVGAKCVRCKKPIELGTPAVRCPRCGSFQHESADDDRECWTYQPVCGACRAQPTAMDTGYTWTPEDL